MNETHGGRERREWLDKLILEARGQKPTEGGSTVISSVYNLGDVVCMRHDPEPYPGTVTCIEIRPGGFTYLVTWCDTRSETQHHDFELALWKYVEPAEQAG